MQGIFRNMGILYTNIIQPINAIVKIILNFYFHHHVVWTNLSIKLEANK